MADATRGGRPNMPVRARDNFPLFFPDVEDVFGDVFRGWGMPGFMPGRMREMERTFVPSMDIHDSGNELVLSAELPGLDPNNVDVSIDHNVLTISGEKREEQTTSDKERQARSTERRYGLFARSITLPEGLDTDQAQARFKHGVLTIAIPKTAQYQKQVKKLDIKTEDGGKE